MKVKTFIGVTTLLCNAFVSFRVVMFFRQRVSLYNSSVWRLAMKLSSWFAFITWHTCYSFDIVNVFVLGQRYTVPSRAHPYIYACKNDRVFSVLVLFIFILVIFIINCIFVSSGLRGKVPNDSLGGNKISITKVMSYFDWWKGSWYAMKLSADVTFKWLEDQLNTHH